MQTRDEMKAEVEKLNEAQRKRMRAIIPSNLDALKVEKFGWITRVVCESGGFRYTAKLGPRGKKISATQVVDANAQDVAW